MVHPDGELAAFQVMSEVTYPGKNAVQLSVKGTVGQLGFSSLAEKNPSGRQAAVGFSLCCRTAPTCVAEASVAKDSSALSWGKARQTARSKATLMSEKAVHIEGNQTRLSPPFLPPFRMAVSGRKI